MRCVEAGLGVHPLILGERCVTATDGFAGIFSGLGVAVHSGVDSDVIVAVGGSFRAHLLGQSVRFPVETACHIEPQTGFQAIDNRAVGVGLGGLLVAFEIGLRMVEIRHYETVHRVERNTWIVVQIRLGGVLIDDRDGQPDNPHRLGVGVQAFDLGCAVLEAGREFHIEHRAESESLSETVNGLGFGVGRIRNKGDDVVGVLDELIVVEPGVIGGVAQS